MLLVGQIWINIHPCIYLIVDKGEYSIEMVNVEDTEKEEKKEKEEKEEKEEAEEKIHVRIFSLSSLQSSISSQMSKTGTSFFIRHLEIIKPPPQ